MKTFLKILITLIIVIIAGFFFLVKPYFVSLITDYDRYTFEYVLENDILRADYGLDNQTTPADYGYEEFYEVNFETLTNELNLSGWYVPAKKEGISKTLLINHGRTSNRLKTLKYLELVNDYGLDTLYNVFIPDLRNSGKSDEAKTALGYEFAEDITASMQMLKSTYGQQEFVLWGFSMGAMASAITVNRPDLVEFQEANGLVVKKLILASPLSNVKETSWVEGQRMGIPKFIFNTAWSTFDGLVDNWAEQMKFSYLLSNNKLPSLVLYGNGDATTPAEILEAEIEGQMNVYPVLFQGADHVQIYTMPEYKERYGSRVDAFLRMD